MRIVSMLSAFIFLVSLSGCGGKSGPVDPAHVSAEQERQIQEAQKKLDDEERQHLAKQGNGGRALTLEQQVEMEERRNQQRRR